MCVTVRYIIGHPSAASAPPGRPRRRRDGANDPPSVPSRRPSIDRRSCEIVVVVVVGGVGGGEGSEEERRRPRHPHGPRQRRRAGPGPVAHPVAAAGGVSAESPDPAAESFAGNSAAAAAEAAGVAPPAERLVRRPRVPVPAVARGPVGRRRRPRAVDAFRPNSRWVSIPAGTPLPPPPFHSRRA